ncbi:hypothetical protein HNR46_002234 [Haloferula luteola]|uniref:Uncharacterized protein n=1 Tax=Haloferula luteola TaxID=595692 RepID=A0A840V3C1_9BACT|nr:hypothetical protein [Haloferula luteola]
MLGTLTKTGKASLMQELVIRDRVIGERRNAFMLPTSSHGTALRKSWMHLSRQAIPQWLAERQFPRNESPRTLVTPTDVRGLIFQEGVERESFPIGSQSVTIRR